MAPGADGREPLDGGCGGCAKATVANSATTTTKHRVDGFNTILSRPMAVAYPSLSTATSGSRSGERTGHRRRLLARACRWAAAAWACGTWITAEAPALQVTPQKDRGSARPLWIAPHLASQRGCSGGVPSCGSWASRQSKAPTLAWFACRARTGAAGGTRGRQPLAASQTPAATTRSCAERADH
jgi:hypothetical protein